MLKKAFDCNTYLCRIGGDEFAAYIYDCNEKTVHKMINKFITLLKENPFSDDDLTIDIRSAIGATKVFTPYLYNRIYDRADKYLYKAKTKQFSFVVKDF